MQLRKKQLPQEMLKMPQILTQSQKQLIKKQITTGKITDGSNSKLRQFFNQIYLTLVNESSQQAYKLAKDLKYIHIDKQKYRKKQYYFHSISILMGLTALIVPKNFPIKLISISFVLALDFKVFRPYAYLEGHKIAALSQNYLQDEQQVRNAFEFYLENKSFLTASDKKFLNQIKALSEKYLQFKKYQQIII